MMKRHTVSIVLLLSLILTFSQARATVTNITDGESYRSYSVQSGTLNVLGGRINCSLNAGGTSTVNVLGGMIQNMTVRDQAMASVQAGYINTLYANPNGQINLSGGYIHQLVIGSGDQQGPSVNIYGRNLNYEHLGPGPIAARITGSWENGGAFCIRVQHNGEGGPYGHIRMAANPEPATVLLLAFGGLILRKRKTI
jgi:hypothetical protein